MDKVFKNFGLYDFFGVFGAGICSLTYFILTYCFFYYNEVMNILTAIKEFNSFVLGVTIVVLAYFLGILLHEMGKYFADSRSGIFGISYYSDIKIIEPFNNCFLRILCPNKYAANQCRKHIDEFVKDSAPDESIKNKSITYVMAYLRYNSVHGTMDKNHSTYGLARGLFAGSIAHLLLSVVYMIRNGFKCESIVLVLISALVCRILYCRAYKAYLSFVRNMYTKFWMISSMPSKIDTASTK